MTEERDSLEIIQRLAIRINNESNPQDEKQGKSSSERVFVSRDIIRIHGRILEKDGFAVWP